MTSAHKQRSFYQQLAHTGIDYYFAGTSQVLQSGRPVVCAACLVILEDDPHGLTTNQQKILDGMLKVLELRSDDYCVAWMASANIPPPAFAKAMADGPLQRGQHDNDRMVQAILKYAPYSVLFLGANIPVPVIPAEAGIHAGIHPETGIIITQTYSPQELEANPSHKRAAFDALLRLKAQIHALCTST